MRSPGQGRRTHRQHRCLLGPAERRDSGRDVRVAEPVEVGHGLHPVCRGHRAVIRGVQVDRGDDSSDPLGRGRIEQHTLSVGQCGDPNRDVGVVETIEVAGRVGPTTGRHRGAVTEIEQRTAHPRRPLRAGRTQRGLVSGRERRDLGRDVGIIEPVEVDGDLGPVMGPHRPVVGRVQVDRGDDSGDPLRGRPVQLDPLVMGQGRHPGSDVSVIEPVQGAGRVRPTTGRHPRRGNRNRAAHCAPATPTPGRPHATRPGLRPRALRPWP